MKGGIKNEMRWLTLMAMAGAFETPLIMVDKPKLTGKYDLKPFTFEHNGKTYTINAVNQESANNQFEKIKRKLRKNNINRFL